MTTNPSNPLPLPKKGEVWGVPSKTKTWRYVNIVDEREKMVWGFCWGEWFVDSFTKWQSWAADKQRIISKEPA